MDPTTYEPHSGIGKTGQSLKDFGERQNALNAALTEQIAALSAQLTQALDRIEALERENAQLRTSQSAENELTKKRFGRCALSLDNIEKDVERLKLTAKLNSNAIDRLTKKDA